MTECEDVKTCRRSFYFLRLNYCSKVLELSEGLSFPENSMCLAVQIFSSTWFKISTAERNL